MAQARIRRRGKKNGFRLERETSSNDCDRLNRLGPYAMNVITKARLPEIKRVSSQDDLECPCCKRKLAPKVVYLMSISCECGAMLYFVVET